MMTLTTLPRKLLLRAEGIKNLVPTVLEQRSLTPCFSRWIATHDTPRGLTWLFGVLDVRQMERMEAYTTPDLLHHLSTVTGGTSVYLSNHSGLRYAFLLSPPPGMPHEVNFPGSERGQVLLGQRYTGERLRCAWDALGHQLVAGMTGSGKSNYLRLVVYQALQEGLQLLLADLDGRTFPMLREHPALLAPLAQTPPAMLEVVERALGECEHRAAVYDTVPGFPDTLDAYNVQAVRERQEALPRILVVLDEFNAAVTAAGGKRSALAQATAELAWRGRKFGINLILAAQEFSKEVVGKVRDQTHAICFKVEAGEVARAIGCAKAHVIPAGRPGLAITVRWGPMQTYYLDKHLLVNQPYTPGVLSSEEQQLVRWSMTKRDGYLTLDDIQAQLKVSQHRARQLAADWEVRGWLSKDANARNARRLTTRIQALLPTN